VLAVKTCRVCGVELVVGENWYPSRAPRRDYICKQCDAEKSRRWREANPEKTREYSHRYREAHPEKARENGRRWQKANPEKTRERCRRHHARKCNTTIKPVDERAVYELNGHMCIYCGAADDLQLDHVIPLAWGGAHCEENLVVACRSCNSSKGARPLEEWLQTQPRALAWVA